LVEDGLGSSEASELLCRAIFALDVYQVLCGCDMVVASLNGRVPDEGTVSEVAMAWARGRPVVGYKSDSRSLLGGEDNPLLTGLFDFHLCGTLEEAVDGACAFREDIEKGKRFSVKREEDLAFSVALGKRIWERLQENEDLREVVKLIANSLAEPLAK
ncbi:hypothetical protein LCGC14_2768010, partial [marine sediment metagenome]